MSRELLFIFGLVLFPAVIFAAVAWGAFGRRRHEGREITSGRAPQTPFSVIAVVGSGIAVAAGLVLLLTIAARSLV